MREILFRGKRLDNGEWIENDCIIHLKERNTVYISAHKENVFLYGDDRLITGIENCAFFGIDPKTISEYTGLTDKNGVKIFEGDIVCTVYDGIENIFVVVWDNDEIGFKATNGKENYGPDGFQYLPCCEIVEVIGNIYDNPELLKKS